MLCYIISSIFTSYVSLEIEQKKKKKKQRYIYRILNNAE